MTRGQRVELSDGDMVTFGQEDSDRIRELAKYPSSSGATLILNSIGSISKFKPQPLTFSRTKGDSPGGAGKQAQASLPQPSRTAEEESATTAPVSSPVTPSRSKCRNRRKSAHTVLPELEDEVPHGAEEPPPLKRPKMEREDEFHNYSMVWSPPGRRGSGEVGQNSPKIEREDPPSHQSKAWPVIGRRASQESSGLKQPKTEAGEEPSHYSRVWPVMERRLSEDAGGQRRIKTESTKSEPYGEEAQSLNVTPPNRKRRGRPRKHPTWNSCQVLTQTLYTVEQCAAERCHLPQDDTVQWVQCDDCDAWYHLACVGCNYNAVKDADFHCGCT